MRYFLMLSLLLTQVLACSQQPSQPTTDRICNSSGCNDRPQGYTSFRPSDDTDPEEQARYQQLVQKAEESSDAAYDLGLRHYRGDGVQQDSYQAIKWMRSAGERGDFEAQKALGRFYLTGLEEMGSDPQEAEKWLAITVSRGDKEAEELLKQASYAKKQDQAYYTWKKRWLPIIHGYWHHGYAYRYRWANRHWNHYHH